MKNKSIAILLSFFFGWTAIHQFYLGRKRSIIIYIFLYITLYSIGLIGVPIFIGFIDFLRLSFMSKNKFNKKYNQSSQNKKSYNTPTTLYSQNHSVIKQEVKDTQFTIPNNYSESNSSLNYNKQYYKNTIDPVYFKEEISSLKDFKLLTNEQILFYQNFKKLFFNKTYLNLNDNKGYAFLLMYDLFNDFEINRNYYKLLHQVEILANKYPYTRKHINKGLKKIKSGSNSIINISEDSGEKIIHEVDINPIENKSNEQTTSHRILYNNIIYDWDDSYWALGEQYKDKLNLDKTEIDILNNLYYPNNIFNDNEFCKRQNLKFFILTIKSLEKELSNRGIDFKSLVNEISDLIIQSKYGYTKSNIDYSYYFNIETRRIYWHIFKMNENYLRGYYHHKRKLNTTLDITIQKPNELLKPILELIPTIFDNNSSKIEQLPEDVHIYLNSINRTRWKIYFKEICNSLRNHKKINFKDEIEGLVSLNIKTPAFENIYYDASKFISKKDKSLSLEFYLKYINISSKSAIINNKKLNKTTQKNLFKDDSQLNKFEVIVNNLIKDKNLDKAISILPTVYQKERREIKLNINEIQKAESQLSNTVELLNEYLDDEANIEEDTKAIKTSDEIFTKHNLIEVNHLNDIQEQLLQLFKSNNLIVSKDLVKKFAANHNLFMESLIDEINEILYETLDDNLIEEEEEHFTIYQEYYNIITEK